MPVTKTAKRALRGSKKKGTVNTRIRTNLEIAIRQAKRNKNKNVVATAISLVDRAVKKKFLHKNKAARIKSRLAKMVNEKPQKTSKK